MIAAALFAAILVAGVALRFWHLTVLPAALYPDEAFYGTDTLRSMASGAWQVFYPNNNGHEGLIVWLLRPAWGLLCSSPPRVLRTLPAGRVQLGRFAGARARAVFLSHATVAFFLRRRHLAAQRERRSVSQPAGGLRLRCARTAPRCCCCSPG